jgi:isocitrate dehydrogenase
MIKLYNWRRVNSKQSVVKRNNLPPVELARSDKPIEQMTKHKIAVITVDGIGNEGLTVGLRVLDAAATKYDIPLQWDHFDWNCDYYLSTKL